MKEIYSSLWFYSKKRGISMRFWKCTLYTHSQTHTHFPFIGAKIAYLSTANLQLLYVDKTVRQNCNLLVFIFFISRDAARWLLRFMNAFRPLTKTGKENQSNQRDNRDSCRDNYNHNHNRFFLYLLYLLLLRNKSYACKKIFDLFEKYLGFTFLEISYREKW